MVVGIGFDVEGGVGGGVEDFGIVDDFGFLGGLEGFGNGEGFGCFGLCKRGMGGSCGLGSMSWSNGCLHLAHCNLEVRLLAQKIGGFLDTRRKSVHGCHMSRTLPHELDLNLRTLLVGWTQACRTFG